MEHQHIRTKKQVAVSCSKIFVLFVHNWWLIQSLQQVTEKSVGVNSRLAAHASLSTALRLLGRLWQGLGVNAVICMSSCATIHHSDSGHSQCRCPCWLFLCLHKKTALGTVGHRMDKPLYRRKKRRRQILHAFSRHLHNANTKCLLLPLCHYGLNPNVKKQLKE